MDAKTFKLAYILLAALAAVCAIIAALLQQKYVAVGFIVLASIIIMIGAMYFSSMVRKEKLDKLK